MSENPDVAELERYNREAVEVCPETKDDVRCEKKRDNHHPLHFHKGGGKVWVTEPKCVRCNDTGTAVAEMGCFGPRRWKRCDCEAGRRNRWSR